MGNNRNYHESVVTGEVVEHLHIKTKAWYIDATLGNGGYALEILKKGGCVLGIEMDPEMLEIARDRIVSACPDHDNFKLIHGNFKDIDTIAKNNGLSKVDGVAFDLGVTNLHLTSQDRGFSFRNPETAIDMRLDANTQAVTGADLLNVLREDQLIDLFSVVLSFKEARILAHQIIEARAVKKIKTIGDFLLTLKPIKAKEDLHYATLPLLALRIAVNSELDNLKEALPKAFDLLEDGGNLVVVSFHSKEDLIVEKFFKSITHSKGKVFSKNYISPSFEEVYKNPKSRSARLRSIRKI